jgi:hypothetical protein
MPKLLAGLSLFTLAFGSVTQVLAQEAGSGTEHKIAQLERQVATLREAYAIARADADEARRQMREVRARLEALGGTALGDSEERLIEVIAQMDAAMAEAETLRQATLNLAAAIETYTRGALVEDEAARQGLDAALRELDVALGLRQAQQAPNSGTMHEATVLSIDSESGLIVINAGRDADIQVGMPMQITRGDQIIARAIVTDVRKKVAGLLVQKQVSSNLVVNVGDSVSVTTND